MTRLLTTFLILAIFWLLLSGHYVPLFFFFAAVSIALVLWLSWRMDRTDREIDHIPVNVSLLRYWFRLTIEAIKANIAMAIMLWRPRLEVRPVVARIQTGQKSRMGKVMYANSITLTPGTVTLEIDEANNVLTVHAIDQRLIDDLNNGMIERLLPDTEH